MKNFSVLVKQMLMSTLTAGMFAFSFSSCSDDLNELEAMGGNATKGESFELTSLEQYSYTVPVQVNVEGDWEIDFRFSDEYNKFCYAIPDKGHGPATIKLCMLDNWTEKRNEGQMIIRDLSQNREDQSFRLLQKCNIDNPNYQQLRARTRGEGEEAKEGEEKKESPTSQHRITTLAHTFWRKEASLGQTIPVPAIVNSTPSSQQPSRPRPTRVV